jgi:hypothetical protein
MKTSEHQSTALQAINYLRNRATRGDTSAIAALHEIATSATEQLAALASFPEEMAASTETRRIAASARSWPINIPAIGEARPAALAEIPAGFGSDLPFRAERGATKPRVFQGSYVGLALTAFRDLDAIRLEASREYRYDLEKLWHLLTDDMKRDWQKNATLLPPLCSDPVVIHAWGEAAALWAEEQCGGQWKTFPWPDEIKRRAKQRTNSRERGLETAVREYLKKGFEKLAKPLPLIPPE